MVNKDQYKKAKRLLFEIDPSERENFEDNLDILTGPPGPTGSKGERGEQGSQGERGDKGDRGAQGLRGEKGDKGDTGERGEKGEDGKSGESVNLKDVVEKLKPFVPKGGGNMNRQIRIAGTDIGTRYTDINFIAGSGITISSVNNDTTKRVDITITSTASGGTTVLTAAGTIDDSNTAFTFVSLPSLLIINGSMYQQTGGTITWAWNAGTLTATLSSPVGLGGSLFGLS